MGLQRVRHDWVTKPLAGSLAMACVGSLFYLSMKTLSCSMWTLTWGMWDLIPWSGIEPGTPALGAWSLSYRTTREIPWTATCKRMKSEHSLTLYIKISSKWIKGLNVRLGNIKLSQENTESTPFDINWSKILSDPPLRLMEIETKRGYCQSKSFCYLFSNLWQSQLTVSKFPLSISSLVMEALILGGRDLGSLK